MLVVALVSMVAFLAVAAVGVRSLWVHDSFFEWGDYGDRAIDIYNGCVAFERQLPDPPRRLITGIDVHQHTAVQLTPSLHSIAQAIRGFEKTETDLTASKIIVVTIPIWPLLLVLLIAPLRWLIARPADAPAFPIITDGPTEA